ncbi:hypothetical protein Purlil1_13425 [Purpureocillium lilacinum]|uniref:Tandem CCCH zinc finger domain-containing protein n=1 Tax=Purpureocillium lilacinum TaxID=33203 RepID=A0ABR0BE32_PURLI|nr:hypothetical protein Purlil1_13425 [Purpureocillium lilacinum]
MTPERVMETAPETYRMRFEGIRDVDDKRTRLIEELLDDLDRKEAALKKVKLDLENEQEVRRRLQQDALDTAVRRQPPSTSPKATVLAGTGKWPTPAIIVNHLVKPDRLGPVLRDDAGHRYDNMMGFVSGSSMELVREARLCYFWFLRGECSLATCTRNHNWSAPLCPFQFDGLLTLARRIPCPQGTLCSDPKCVYGHRITSAQNEPSSPEQVAV